MGAGIQSVVSQDTVDETVARLEALLKDKGVKLFCVVDHSGEAAKAGLTMPNTKLLIFGSPVAGTPVMLAAPSVALDLPLKILVAEGEGGKTLLSWNDATWLSERHGFGAELAAKLQAAGMFAKQMA